MGSELASVLAFRDIILHYPVRQGPRDAHESSPPFPVIFKLGRIQLF